MNRAGCAWGTLTGPGAGLIREPPEAHVQYSGDGTGTSPVPLGAVRAGFAQKVLAKDMDNDGVRDLVVEVLEYHPDRRKGRVVVVHGLPAGGLSATPRELFEFLPVWETPDFGDIDGNGWKDAVFGDVIYLQVEKEVFEGPYMLGMGMGSPYTPLLADVDGDGRTDLVNHQFRGFFTTPFLAVYLHESARSTKRSHSRIPMGPRFHGFVTAAVRMPPATSTTMDARTSP